MRQNAVNLAVGGIIGGNAFDVLFLSFSDAAYREGSIYHAIGAEHRMLIAVSIVMTCVLLLGLLKREKRGFANIGFESTLIIVRYAGSVIALAMQ